MPTPDYLSFQINFDAPPVVSALDEVPLWSAMCGLLLLKYVPLKRMGRVLDAGCGTGFPTLELAQRLGEGCEVIGLDPWQTALDRAQFKAQLYGLKNVTLHAGQIEHLSFPDHWFDLVVSNLGINNFEQPGAALQECWRVLKPGGTLGLATNLKGHMAEFYAVFESTLQESGDRQALQRLETHVNHRATVPGLVTLLEKNGFKLQRVEEQQAVMRFADGSALLRHYFIKLGFLDAWKEVVAAGERETFFPRLEERLNEQAARLGELALTIPLAYLEAGKPA